MSSHKSSHANLKTSMRARLERALDRRKNDVSKYSKSGNTKKLNVATKEVANIEAHIASLRTKPKHPVPKRKSRNESK